MCLKLSKTLFSNGVVHKIFGPMKKVELVTDDSMYCSLAFLFNFTVLLSSQSFGIEDLNLSCDTAINRFVFHLHIRACARVFVCRLLRSAPYNSAD